MSASPPHKHAEDDQPALGKTLFFQMRRMTYNNSISTLYKSNTHTQVHTHLCMEVSVKEHYCLLMVMCELQPGL